MNPNVRSIMASGSRPAGRQWVTGGAIPILREGKTYPSDVPPAADTMPDDEPPRGTPARLGPTLTRPATASTVTA
ncbi:MAG: hypothetical protein FJ386_12430 [Verrucomicrobia bacterium]|nr:hypothetical protein [Verrucomicrobiota bacterium]